MRLFFILVMLSAAAAHAQKKPSYTASIEAALVKGNSDNSYALLFSNGIRYKNITAGIGAGIDGYLFRSLPVFVDVRKDFGHHHIQPFISYSAGVNISAVKDAQKGAYNWYPNADFKNGFFTKASVGASARLNRTLRFFISAGYSYKTTKLKYDIYNYAPALEIDRSTDIFRMNRWSFAAGLRL